jgi:photosystem II stability/assembly factor-like uncharacterized protein
MSDERLESQLTDLIRSSADIELPPGLAAKVADIPETIPLRHSRGHSIGSAAVIGAVIVLVAAFVAPRYLDNGPVAVPTVAPNTIEILSTVQLRAAIAAERAGGLQTRDVVADVSIDSSRKPSLPSRECDPAGTCLVIGTLQGFADDEGPVAIRQEERVLPPASDEASLQSPVALRLTARGPIEFLGHVRLSASGSLVWPIAAALAATATAPDEQVMAVDGWLDGLGGIPCGPAPDPSLAPPPLVFQVPCREYITPDPRHLVAPDSGGVGNLTDIPQPDGVAVQMGAYSEYAVDPSFSPNQDTDPRKAIYLIRMVTYQTGRSWVVVGRVDATAAPVNLTSAAPTVTPLITAIPSASPSATPGLGGPALAQGEEVVQMGRSATGGWLLTQTRLLTTDGSNWRDCWSSGTGIGRSMPGMDAVFVGGVIHVRVSDKMWTSADECATWSQASFPVDPLGLAFPTARVGYIVGGYQTLLANPNATIFKTEDGGMHWKATGTVHVSDQAVEPMISFADSIHGWVTDGVTVWTTSNGGAAWSKTTLPKPGSVAGSLDVLMKSDAGDGSAVIAARYDTTFGMGGAPLQLVFYRTVDFGEHWTVASVIEVPETHGLSLVDTRTWVVLDPSEPAAARTTTDAGSAWQTTAVRQRWPFTAVQIDFADATHGWLVVREPYPPCPQSSSMPSFEGCALPSPPEHLVATDDGGATWVELTP